MPRPPEREQARQYDGHTYRLGIKFGGEPARGHDFPDVSLASLTATMRLSSSSSGSRMIPDPGGGVMWSSSVPNLSADLITDKHESIARRHADSACAFMMLLPSGNFLRAMIYLFQ
jgi:hypothetical protein